MTESSARTSTMSPPAWYAVLWGAIGIASIVAVVGFWAASEVLESVSEGDGLAAWDRPVLNWAVSVRTPAADRVIAWYSNTGGPLWQPIITLAVVAFLCWRYRSLRHAYRPQSDPGPVTDRTRDAGARRGSL